MEAQVMKGKRNQLNILKKTILGPHTKYLKVPGIEEDVRAVADDKNEPGNRDNGRNLDVIDRIVIVLHAP